MDRWLACSGPPICREKLVVEPQNSLLVQSWYAQENYIDGVQGMPDGAFPTNGLVQCSNLHPFAYVRWMFQHNGEIPGFNLLKRDVQLQVAPELFPEIHGTTDCASTFYLALTHGVMDAPVQALEKTIGCLEHLRAGAGIEAPLHFTCALSDGKDIYALRYSSDADSKTLYINKDHHGAEALLDEVDRQRPASIVLSEPLNDQREKWQKIPEASFATMGDGKTMVEAFRPR